MSTLIKLEHGTAPKIQGRGRTSDAQNSGAGAGMPAPKNAGPEPEPVSVPKMAPPQNTEASSQLELQTTSRRPATLSATRERHIFYGNRIVWYCMYGRYCINTVFVCIRSMHICTVGMYMGMCTIRKKRQIMV
jgi:hypothetical protein